MDLTLEFLEPDRICGRQGGERRGIDPDAAHLHVGEHRRERHLDVREQVGEPLALKERRQALGEFLHKATVRGRLPRLERMVNQGRRCGIVDRDAVADRRLGEAEIPLARLEQIGGEQRVERGAGHPDATRAQGHVLPLEIVPLLGKAGVGKQPADVVVRGERFGVKPAACVAGSDRHTDRPRENRSARRPCHAEGERRCGPQPGDNSGDLLRPARLLERDRPRRWPGGGLRGLHVEERPHHRSLHSSDRSGRPDRHGRAAAHPHHAVEEAPETERPQ